MVTFKKVFSYVDKKRIRIYCDSSFLSFSVPCLLDMQVNSYKNFFYFEKFYKEFCLENVFQSIFPIVSYTKYNVLEYLSYKFEKNTLSIKECCIKEKTFSAALKINVRLISYDKNFLFTDKVIKRKVEQDIFICDLPVMTDYGTFIINGIERVVVSQLYRSPGILFEVNTKQPSKVLYTARVIPYRGSWLDFELDPSRDCFHVRIDRKRKFNVTILLKALGYSTSNILNLFFDFSIVRFCKEKNVEISLTLRCLYGEIVPYDLKKNNIVVIQKGELIQEQHLSLFGAKNVMTFLAPISFLIGHVLAVDIVEFHSNTILYTAGSFLSELLLNDLRNFNIQLFYFIFRSNISAKESIIKSLESDSKGDVKIFTRSDALFFIHRILRPSEQSTTESATGLFYQLFFDSTKYDLSLVGVLKYNSRLGRNLLKTRTLSRSSLIYVIKEIFNVSSGYSEKDDIDHLINRRVRCVGELVESHFQSGFLKVERSIKERLTYTESDMLIPKDLINTKVLMSTLNEFFYSDQLSQFMDQTNPLSGITHQRRISAFGIGGLTREHAGFEVRDVHYTHYGRLCPVETPEGPNIGLVNSLSIYSRVNLYGFLETPYYKVKSRKILNKIFYLTALDEKDCVIAQANVKITKDDYIINNSLLCRYNDIFKYFNADDVDYIDVSSQQVFSIAAALIPFLEHDDANRALMGSNMQRQAVPLLYLEKPLVGTGIEKVFSANSFNVIFSKGNGIVNYVDNLKVIISSDFRNFRNFKVEIYDFIKYFKSNQNTCLNQKLLVLPGDNIRENDVIADGFSTDVGELALGKNILTGFMSWYGYNFEDSIVVSEKLVKNEVFSSIHIEEFTCLVRETRYGSEEITSVIPNVSTTLLKNLDTLGIVCVGTEVFQGDILVGKVTPLGEVQASPEEKLLRAIFGEKACKVRDSSLRVPIGLEGIVIDVQVNSKISTKSLPVDFEFVSFKNNIYKTFQIEKNNLFRNVKKFLLNKELLSCKFNFLYGKFITQNYLKKLHKQDWLTLTLLDSASMKYLQLLLKKFINLKNNYDDSIKVNKKSYINNDSLLPGILKVVKVFIAVRRTLKAGDKMSGRHGNKGVVSVVVPVENMPYLEDGTTLDMILNPLSVPSRMNVGQIFEAHIGLAAKFIGEKLYDLYFLTNSRLVLQQYLDKIYDICFIEIFKRINFFSFTDCELYNFIITIKNGFPFAVPIFSNFDFLIIKKLLNFIGLPETGQLDVYDGFSGNLIRQKITVGFVYMLKLNHLVDDKIHARSIGSYSLITQQPLGGKAQFGGQRFGEMEVWALEAYGAAYILQEMLTIKSDDVTGRIRAYKNIIDNDYFMMPGIPESFNVLVKEIRALGLNLEFTS